MTTTVMWHGYKIEFTPLSHPFNIPSLQDHVMTALAAYLIGAGVNQYFGVIGWRWNCAEIPMGTLGPLLSKPLGPPQADPVTTMRAVGNTTEIVYTRSFGVGTHVSLNVSTGTQAGRFLDAWTHCCIRWSDGTNNTCNAGDCGFAEGR